MEAKCFDYAKKLPGKMIDVLQKRFRLARAFMMIGLAHQGQAKGNPYFETHLGSWASKCSMGVPVVADNLSISSRFSRAITNKPDSVIPQLSPKIRLFGSVNHDIVTNVISYLLFFHPKKREMYNSSHISDRVPEQGIFSVALTLLDNF